MTDYSKKKVLQYFIKVFAAMIGIIIIIFFFFGNKSQFYFFNISLYFQYLEVLSSYSDTEQNLDEGGSSIYKKNLNSTSC